MTTQSAFEIQLKPGQPQKFTIPLAGIPYIFRMQWNDASQSWTLDIADQDDNALIYGIPVVTGLDLLAPYEHLGIGGALIVQTDHDADAVPTFDNLGVSGRLYFVPGALFDINQMMAAIRQTPVEALPPAVLATGLPPSPTPSPTPVPAPPGPTPPPPPPPAPAPVPPTGSPDELLADGWPRKILACYFESYHYGDGFKIDQVPLEFNAIYLFTCSFNTDGSAVFNDFSNVTPAAIQRVRARGQRVILTVGGAGLQFNFTVRAQSQHFVDSFQAIYTQAGGLDGVDFNNYEQLTSVNSTELIWIAGQLRALYGPTFAVSSPPGGANTGGAAVNGFAMGSSTDLDLVGAMKDAGVLSWVSPQFYDWSFYKLPGSVKQLVDRWALRVGEQSVVVGFSANYNFDNALTLAECVREWDAITAAHPDIRGMYCWTAKTDVVTGGDEWGRAMREKIAGQIVTPVPTADIAVVRHPADWLKIGQYLIDYNLQALNIPEGTASWQFTQATGRSNIVGTQGQVDWRSTWKWPFTDQSGIVIADRTDLYPEVKGFPCIIHGARPGDFGPDIFPAWEFTVRAPDGVVVPVGSAPPGTPQSILSNWQPAGGSIVKAAPSGGSGSTLLPRQLPAQVDLHAELRFAFNGGQKPTGIGHTAFDIWLTDPIAGPDQAQGFQHAPITHEIMIPITNWGNYGSPHTVGGAWSQQPQWYLGDAVLGGVTYMVYGTGSGGKVEYNFGALDGSFTNEETGLPRRGWKFIVFEPQTIPFSPHPANPDGVIVVPIGEILNWLHTKTDSRGIPLARGTEYVQSIELGSEIVVGAGDLTVFGYRVATGAIAPAAPAPAPAAPPPPAPTPPPPPAPPPAPTDTAPATLIFTGTGQPMGAWLDTDAASRFQDAPSGGSALPDFNNRSAGRWVDRSGNVSDVLNTGTPDTYMVTDNVTGTPLFPGIVIYGDKHILQNLGASTTGFWFAIALWYDSYYGTLFSDSDGTRSFGMGSQTKGIRLQHDADVTEWQLCVGTGTGQVAAHVPSGAPVFASPHRVFVLDGYVDPANHLVSLRMNKGTPVTAALAAFAHGLTPMCMAHNPDGSDDGTPKFARIVMTKDFIPVSTTRDAVVDELMALMGM